MQAGNLLKSIVDEALPGLRGLDEAVVGIGSAGKWSAKEVMGHLIDSASNNHRRFVVAPSKGDLIFDGYDQEYWVSTQGYVDMPWQDILDLWYAYNRQLSFVMNRIPEEVRYEVRQSHNFDKIGMRPVPRYTPTTLEYLMCDYIWHLEHHLAQVLPDYQRVFHW